jgi:hypothetical protein
MEDSSAFRPAKKEVNHQLAAKLAGLDVIGVTHFATPFLPILAI